MLTPEQLVERKNYIGGSDAAGVLGLSRWDTPLKIWAEKTGKIEAPDISDQLQIILGNKLEQTVAELFTDRTGKKVRRNNRTVYHSEFSFLGVNLDREVVGEDAVLECKTASAWKAKEWAGEEIPQEYTIQVHHALMVTGAEKGYLAVLIGNQDFQIREILREKSVIASMLEKEVAFWTNYVVADQMPMQVLADDNDVLFQLFPVSDPSQDIELPDEANIIMGNLEAMQQEQRALGLQIDKSKAELKALLKGSEAGRTGLYRVTWKTQVANRVDVERMKIEAPELYKKWCKASPSRVLRYSKLSKG